jgi:acyl-CoA dehydrogenase
VTAGVDLADLEALRSTARDVLGQVSPSSAVREQMDAEAGWDSQVWQRLCVELGVAGTATAEEHGGAGLSLIELGMLFEEAGRVLLCAPMLSVAGLAIPLLAAIDDAESNHRYLPSLVGGTTVATVVTSSMSGRVGFEHLEITGGGRTVTGSAGFVVDGATADLVLVPARTEIGVELFAVDPRQAAVSVMPLVTLDGTRRLAHLRFDRADATSVGGRDVSEELRWSTAVAQTLLACEQVGVAAQCLDMTVDYARTRVQFGRPIGSFQIVKQKLADLLIRVESARSAAVAAARAAATSSPDLLWMASVAKAYCSEACLSATAETIQLHGGIGFTWDHDAHLYFKRARTSAELLGCSSVHYAAVDHYLSQT